MQNIGNLCVRLFVISLLTFRYFSTIVSLFGAGSGSDKNVSAPAAPAPAPAPHPCIEHLTVDFGHNYSRVAFSSSYPFVLGTHQSQSGFSADPNQFF